MDEDVRKAIARSNLRDLPVPVIGELLTGARPMILPAGTVIHRQGDSDAHLDLVVSGVIKAFVAAADGRMMTIRYCRSGALIGAVSLFARVYTMPATTKAVVDSELWRLSPYVARQAARTDVAVAQAFLAELGERALTFIHEIPDNSFASVGQRVARHLLDLAVEASSPSQRNGEIVVAVSQQELADSVGTAREVVVRVLRELREDGALRTERNRIVILDPAMLTASGQWDQSP
jgi:CRP/FNR family cyclic AMP-dependent transcriptional regulator